MDIQAAVQMLTQLGALGILGIMVYRAPQILAALSDHVQTVISNVRATQSEALKVFQAEMEKVVTITSDRLNGVETNMGKMVVSLTDMIVEMKAMSERVGVLERGKSTKSDAA